MSSRQRSATVRHTRHSAMFGGAPKNVLVGYAEAAGARWQWYAGSDELAVPLRAAAEVEARMVSAGYDVQLALSEFRDGAG